MDDQELDDLVGQELPGTGIGCRGVSDELCNLTLTTVRHGLVGREDLPESPLHLIGEAALKPLSHDFLSGLPSLLMVCDDFRLHSVLNQDTPC